MRAAEFRPEPASVFLPQKNDERFSGRNKREATEGQIGFLRVPHPSFSMS